MGEVGTVYEIISYFFIYAFLGWCCEVIFAAVKEGRFVNRGFLNGPACPIYGFGVITVLMILWGVKDNFVLLFFGSVLLTSVLEYVTGYILEKFFHMRWWDYSSEHFNIKGYVCLKFSILWGLACLIVVDIVHPAIENLVLHLPVRLTVVLLCVLTFAMLADAIITAIGISNTNKYLKLLSSTGIRLRKLSDTLGENLFNNTINIVQKSDAIKENLDERYEKTKHELEEQRAAVQAKFNELKSRKPLTARRIFAAFPDLSALEKNITMIKNARLEKRTSEEKEKNNEED